MKRVLAFAAGAAAWACLPNVTPSQCVLDSDCGAGSVCIGGLCRAGARTDGGLGFCPTLQPRLSQINANLFQIGCGVRTSVCHNGDAARGPVPSSGLDLSANVYGALVNAPAQNVGGHQDAGVLVLVRPGDPDNSFLVQKLRLTASQDYASGGGQPPDHPGELCASAQAAVAQWIAQGAQPD